MKKLLLLICFLAAVIANVSAQIGASCLKFDGVDDFAVNFAFPHFGPVMTVECWVFIDNPDNTNANGEPTFINRNSNESYDPWFGLDGDLSFYANNNEIINIGVVPVGSWNHVAFSYDGTTSRLFINGVMVGSNTDDPSLDNSLGWFSIGAEVLEQNCPAVYEDDDIDYLFEGKLDEVRISSVARYTTNFTPSMTAFVPDINTVALYHLDEAQGQTAFDASANSHDLTLGCSPSVDINDPAWLIKRNIPTLSEWSLIILGMSLSIFGLVSIRQGIYQLS